MLDTHCHWFDLEANGTTWYKNWPDKRDEELRKTYLPVDYFDEAEGQIKTAIHVQVAHVYDENEWVKQLSDKRETGGAMVAWLDLLAEPGSFAAQLSQLKAAAGNRQLVSVRHVAEAEPDADWLSRPNVAINLNQAELPFDLLIRTRNLSSALKLVKQCPNVPFVIDHMAKPDVTGDTWNEEPNWLAGMEALSKEANVHCKISGFYGADPTASFTPAQSRVNHFVATCCRLFGPGRLMWGSDWPVSLGLNGIKLPDNIDMFKNALKSCNCTSAQIDSIFDSNGRSFYKLI